MQLSNRYVVQSERTYHSGENRVWPIGTTEVIPVRVPNWLPNITIGLSGVSVPQLYSSIPELRLTHSNSMYSPRFTLVKRLEPARYKDLSGEKRKRPDQFQENCISSRKSAERPHLNSVSSRPGVIEELNIHVVLDVFHLFQLTTLHVIDRGAEIL